MLYIYTHMCISLRVQVPNIYVLKIFAIVLVVQVLGKYTIIEYLDPQGMIAVSIDLSPHQHHHNHVSDNQIMTIRTRLRVH